MVLMKSLQILGMSPYEYNVYSDGKFNLALSFPGELITLVWLFPVKRSSSSLSQYMEPEVTAWVLLVVVDWKPELTFSLYAEWLEIAIYLV